MKIARPISYALTACLTASCSVLVDQGTSQCRTDADCVHFGGNPYCKNHVCVPSGLGPAGCFVGDPVNQGGYLNACSTASCVPFDNCQRLGLCGAAATPASVDPSNATIPPLVNPASTPTSLCASAGPNIIYMYGTSDFAPLLRAVQPLLSSNTPPYRGVYQNASSCAGVASVFDPTKGTIKNPAPTAAPNYAFYFDDNGTQVSCLLADAGNAVDLGVSNLFSSTCNTDTASYVSGTAVNDYTGPVVPFVMSVPASSSELAISAEAAHVVFGRGGRGDGAGGALDAAPWIDPTYYFIRSASAGSTVLTSLLVNVPKSKFWGVDRLSTDNLRDSMLASTATSQSIGILSIDYADKNRGNLRSLYLQASGQRCGYLPDSTPNSFDKMNVRDGHYPLWGYVHFFAPSGPGGVPSNAAKAMVTRFAVARLDQQLLDNIIGASLVPQCAMKVVRAGEIADYGVQKGLRCGCYFDAKTTGSTACAPCAASSDCPSDHPACNYGYCEVS